MGWTVLYIAFGIVALWLLGEVLLQYKARLRWRLLAFVGFLGVVLGVLIPSVFVIALGAVAFAVGQTYVTLSFRRGFEAGWAVSGRPSVGGIKRRRGEPDDQDPNPDAPGPESAEGAFQDYDRNKAFGQDDDYDRDDVFTPNRPLNPTAAETTSVYEPQPLPDDTGSYGVYNTAAYANATDPDFAGTDQAYAAAGQTQDQAYAAAAQGDGQNYGYDQYTGYDQQQYGYDTTGQQQYAAYSDPYTGTQTYGGTGYDTGYDGQQQYPSRATHRTSTATAATPARPRPAVCGSRSSATTRPTAANSRTSSTPTRATASNSPSSSRSRAPGTTSSTVSEAC